MPKLSRVTKVKVFFLVLVYGFNFDLLEFSAAILEKSLLRTVKWLSFLFFFFLQCFAQFSTILKSATDIFAQKIFPKDSFNSKILRLISNWTLNCTPLGLSTITYF